MSSTPELLYLCVSTHVNGLVLAVILVSVMSAGTHTLQHVATELRLISTL